MSGRDKTLPATVSPAALTSIDALLPFEMAEKAETVGVRKAGLDFTSTFVLAVLAGAFIALGAVLANVVAAGSAEVLPFGVVRLLMGLVFSLGLILVLVGGAELFTGNALIVMAWASRKIGAGRLFRNWTIVFAGNLVGSIATAALVYVSGHHEFGLGSVGLTALATAQAKLQLGFVQAIALGVLCNTLVCLAVWLTLSARSTADRVLAIVPPITAFVASGFEHSVANMYFIPIGLAIKWGASPTFWTAIDRSPSDYPELTVRAFLVDNLFPVTLGNIVGGAVLVGAVYWFVFLRASLRGRGGRE